MTEAELLTLAGELGFDRAAVLDTGEIPLEPAFRKYCQDNVCGKYGANYACPPDCGTTEEMARRLRAYRRALVLQTCWALDGQDGEQIRSAKARHNRLTRALLDCCGGGLMAGASGCDLCSPCLRAAGEPCRFPDSRFSCMSAYCIHVAKLAERCGMAYYSEGTLHLFSLCCFDPLEEP